MPHNFLVAGAGFSGAVMAHELAKNLDCTVTVIDKRPHVGGNCHTAEDPQTGITIHTYGPHIFHTDRKDVWDYINRFSSFGLYIHRVRATVNNKVYALPINLHTINLFFNTNFTPAEAAAFIQQQGDGSIGEPQNFEEQALKFIGRDLYEAFFRHYTMKQWGVDPRKLPATILKRLPVRFDYNDSYYFSRYQGIPLEGYTPIVNKLLDHPSIRVRLNTSFEEAVAEGTTYDHVFFTGPIDEFFQYRHGRLSYRTVYFEKKYARGDFQGCPVINYTGAGVPFTRITEFKYFTPWQKFDDTVYFVEYSKDTGPADDAYYPMRLTEDKRRLRLYVQDALGQKGITFLGRLATYRYMDMHQVIGEALDYSKRFIQDIRQHNEPAVFPVQENTIAGT